MMCDLADKGMNSMFKHQNIVDRVLLSFGSPGFGRVRPVAGVHFFASI
jgi:hypothetical protein